MGLEDETDKNYFMACHFHLTLKYLKIEHMYLWITNKNNTVMICTATENSMHQLHNYKCVLETTKPFSF